MPTLNDIINTRLAPCSLRAAALRAVMAYAAGDRTDARVTLDPRPTKYGTAAEVMAKNLMAGYTADDVISIMVLGCGCPTDQVLAALLRFAAGAQPAPLKR